MRINSLIRFSNGEYEYENEYEYEYENKLSHENKFFDKIF